MKRLVVIGSGQMGIGIAQVSATAGFKVQVIDKSKEALQKAQENLISSFKVLQAKGKLREDHHQQALDNLQFTQELPQEPWDLIIEAIIEDIDQKRHLFKDIEEKVSPRTLLASNTSSFSITQLARDMDHPERFIGIHFMNPVPLIPLVEIISGKQTREETVSQAQAYCSLLQKTAILVKDRPGFIVNRLLIPMINEAFFALSEKTASAEDIDVAMTLGANHPLGPLHLADLIGLDTCLAIMELFQKQLGQEKYCPCPLLVKYVTEGKLGRKTGEGVFHYEGKMG